MSLIQNALKRKAEEGGDPPPGPNRAMKKWILPVALLLVLTIGNTVFLVHQSLGRKQESAPAVQSEPMPSPESVSTPEPQNIVWPELIYSGLSDKEGVPAVIINGKSLVVGDRIDEVEILKILPTMILIEFRGEKRILRF